MSILLLGLLRHVVSDKYVDVDFENSHEQKCQTCRHVNFKNGKKSLILLIPAGVTFVLFLFTVVLIYMYI